MSNYEVSRTSRPPATPAGGWPLWSPQVEVSTLRRLWGCAGRGPAHAGAEHQRRADRGALLPGGDDSISPPPKPTSVVSPRCDGRSPMRWGCGAGGLLDHRSGATSRFVTENTSTPPPDREALDLLRDDSIAVMDDLANFALRWKDLPCLGQHRLPAGRARDRGQAGDALGARSDPRPLGNRASTLRASGSWASRGRLVPRPASWPCSTGMMPGSRPLIAWLLPAFGFERTCTVAGQTHRQNRFPGRGEPLWGRPRSAHRPSGRISRCGP